MEGNSVYFSSAQRQFILKQVLDSLFYEDNKWKKMGILGLNMVCIKSHVTLTHLLKHKIFLTIYPLHEVSLYYACNLNKSKILLLFNSVTMTQIKLA